MIATAALIRRPSAEDISMHAYFLWEQHARPHNRDQEFWFKAERVLLSQIQRKETQRQKEAKAPVKRVSTRPPSGLATKIETQTEDPLRARSKKTSTTSAKSKKVKTSKLKTKATAETSRKQSKKKGIPSAG
ncbi:MAG: DUF2934 domain-containing protein [Verrucomicrobiota bacterium]|nr:DUF2934 domain-containing protein [Verrucomicrobiota bacterium]